MQDGIAEPERLMTEAQLETVLQHLAKAKPEVHTATRLEQVRAHYKAWSAMPVIAAKLKAQDPLASAQKLIMSFLEQFDNVKKIKPVPSKPPSGT